MVSCGGEGADEREAQRTQSAAVPQATDIDAVLRRERVAVFFAKKQDSEALSELQPLLDRDPPAAADLVRAAQIGLRSGDWDLATANVERAIELYPNDPGALYVRARLYYLDGLVAVSYTHLTLPTKRIV